jgi:hypothetical protein
MSGDDHSAALSWGGAFLGLLLLAAAAERIGDRGFEGRCGDSESESIELISIPPLAHDEYRDIAMNLIARDRSLSRHFRSPATDTLMEFDERNVFAGRIPSGLGDRDPIVVVIGHSLYCGTAGCSAYLFERNDGEWRVATGIDAYNFIDEAVVWAAKGPVRGQWDLNIQQLRAPQCVQPPAHGRPLLVSQTTGYLRRNGEWRLFCRRCDERG